MLRQYNILNQTFNCLIGLLLTFSTQASSSLEQVELDKVHVELKKYTTQDGLPSQFISCGTQGPNGFIWLGTRDGLVRFDGENFITFTTQQGLTSNSISKIASLNSEWLWLICADHAFDPNMGGEVVLFNCKSHEVVKLKTKFSIKNEKFKDLKTIGDSSLILYSTKSNFYIYRKSTGIAKIPFVLDTDNNYLPGPNLAFSIRLCFKIRF